MFKPTIFHLHLQYQWLSKFKSFVNTTLTDCNAITISLVLVQHAEQVGQLKYQTQKACHLGKKSSWGQTERKYMSEKFVLPNIGTLFYVTGI